MRAIRNGIPVNWEQYERYKAREAEDSARRDRVRARREKKEARLRDKEWRSKQREYEAIHEREHASSSDRDTSLTETTYDPTPRGLPAVYRSIIGPPPKCGPDDRLTARMYVARIEQALRQDGTGYGDSERCCLRKLRAKWQARAEGKDARYIVMGTKGGRANQQTASRIAFLSGPQLVLAKVRREREAYAPGRNSLLGALAISVPPKKVKLVLGKTYWEMTWDQIRKLHA